MWHRYQWGGGVSIQKTIQGVGVSQGRLTPSLLQVSSEKKVAGMGGGEPEVLEHPPIHMGDPGLPGRSHT